MSDDFDFDFGFSLVDEQDLEVVQKASSDVESASAAVDQLQEKCDTLYNMILPLLNNLAKNPEKDYIKWAGKDRIEKIELFSDKLREVYTR